MWIISRDDPSLCDSCFLSSPPSSPIQPIQMRPNLNWSLSRKMKSRPPGNLYPKSHRKGSAKNKPTRYLRPRKHLTKYDKIHSSLQLALSLSLTSLIAAFSFSIRWVYTFHQVVLWVIPDPDQLAHSYRKNGDPKKESVAKTDRHRETRNDLRLPSYLLAVTSIYPQQNCKNTTQPVASQICSQIFPQLSIHTSLLFQFPILCIS